MIKGLLVLAICIFILNLAYLFVSPIIKNTMLEGKMTEVARNHGRKGEAEIHAEIMVYVYDRDIDLEENELMVEVTDEGDAHVAARYETHASFWNYTRTYRFAPVSGDKARLYWSQERRAH
jgi:hypothetical protein